MPTNGGGDNVDAAAGFLECIGKFACIITEFGKIRAHVVGVMRLGDEFELTLTGGGEYPYMVYKAQQECWQIADMRHSRYPVRAVHFE